MLEIAIWVAVVFAAGHARRATRAVRRMVNGMRRLAVGVLRQGARLVLVGNLPPGGIMLEVHGNGEVWLTIKPVRPERAPQRRNG